MSDLWKCALIRAARTAIDYVVGSTPAGVVITPAMLEHIDMHYCMIAFAAWFMTGFFACLCSFLMALKTGLPEVEKEEELENRFDLDDAELELFEEEDPDEDEIGDDVIEPYEGDESGEVE